MVETMNNVKRVPNRSKTYLLPLLAEEVHIPNNLINNLVDTYLSDSRGAHENCIYLLFNYDSKDPNFLKFENTLFKNKHFVNLYELNTRVLYVLKFPKAYIKEYNMFKQSKYSKFGEDTKIIIVKFLSKLYGSNPKIIPIIKKIKQVLSKAESLKVKLETELNVVIKDNQELGELIDLNKENYKFKENEGEDGDR